MSIAVPVLPELKICAPQAYTITITTAILITTRQVV